MPFYKPRADFSISRRALVEIQFAHAEHASALQLHDSMAVFLAMSPGGTSASLLQAKNRNYT